MCCAVVCVWCSVVHGWVRADLRPRRNVVDVLGSVLQRAANGMGSVRDALGLHVGSGLRVDDACGRSLGVKYVFPRYTHTHRERERERERDIEYILVKCISRCTLSTQCNYLTPEKEPVMN